MFDKCKHSTAPDKLCAMSSGLFCGRGTTSKDKATGRSRHVNKIEEMKECPLKK